MDDILNECDNRIRRERAKQRKADKAALLAKGKASGPRSARF